MDAALTFGFWHALDAMNAAFVLEFTVSALPAHLKNDVLEAAHPGFVLVDHFDFPPLTFGIVAVHTEQISHEQAGFVTAGPGANLHNDVLIVARVLGQ